MINVQTNCRSRKNILKRNGSDIQACLLEYYTKSIFFSISYRFLTRFIGLHLYASICFWTWIRSANPSFHFILSYCEVKSFPTSISQPGISDLFRRWAKGDWDFRILILSKTLMELIFNPCGEFVKSVGPSANITLLASTLVPLGSFQDLLRSVQMLKREWGCESNGKLPHIFNPW